MNFMLRAAAALLVLVAFLPFLPTTTASADEGSDHLYCCASWRGCWAYSDDLGWYKFREDDCISTDQWQPGSYSLWRCKCPKRPLGHLPPTWETRHPRQAPSGNPKG